MSNVNASVNVNENVFVIINIRVMIHIAILYEYGEVVQIEQSCIQWSIH